MRKRQEEGGEGEMRKKERRDREKLVEEGETREGRGGRKERIQEEESLYIQGKIPSL